MLNISFNSYRLRREDQTCQNVKQCLKEKATIKIIYLRSWGHFDWGIREILLAIVFSWNKWLCWLRWYNSEPERL